MKIALIGHGAMGKLIERLALEKGYEVGVSEGGHFCPPFAGTGGQKCPPSVDVAIDFSTAEAVKGNVETCVAAGVPLVEGTTGWNDQKDEIERIVKASDGAFIYGANFSIGVNLFYRIADHAAELFSRFPEYETFIEEQHHSRKKDAPSGTALKLKEIVSKHIEVGDIAATRAGNVPGTHRVGFDGTADQIMLEHTARSREGFAFGAILAAEWIRGKKGFYEFGDVMDEMISRK